MTYTADKRLYLNGDKTEVVEEDSPEARSLLVGEGGTLTDEEAARYGLTGKKAAVKQPEPVPSTAADPEPQDKQDAEAPETKAVAAPPENKAQTMRVGKGSRAD